MLACNRSYAYRNKRKIGKGENTGFFPIVWTAQAMINHLKAGHAITTGFYGRVDNYGYPKTDTTHWISSRLLMLDCDNLSYIDLNRDDFVRQYALCVYATSSSTPEQPRSRAIFLLDTPIKYRAQYKELAETLAMFTLANLHPDQNATKLTQRCYGSKHGFFLEHPDNLLPLAVMKHQIAQYRYEKSNQPVIKKVGYSQKFNDHAQNTDRVLAGDHLLEGERNNRINEASYNLSIRGLDDITIMRKLLPLATASGLSIRESERAIESGCRGATRDALKRSYVDNRKPIMTAEAKRLFVSIMTHRWKSGYTIKVALAMCKMFARQGQNFFLTHTLIARMTEFDMKTVKKHVEIILKSGLFRRAGNQRAHYHANPATDETMLMLDHVAYTVNFEIFDEIFDARVTTFRDNNGFTVAMIKVFSDICRGRNSRMLMSFSRNHAQRAITRLMHCKVLGRKGLRYIYKGLTGISTLHDIVLGKSVPRNRDESQSNEIICLPDKIEELKHIKTTDLLSRQIEGDVQHE